jgi:hypothetical protein
MIRDYTYYTYSQPMPASLWPISGHRQSLAIVNLWPSSISGHRQSLAIANLWPSPISGHLQSLAVAYSNAQWHLLQGISIYYRLLFTGPSNFHCLLRFTMDSKSRSELSHLVNNLAQKIAQPSVSVFLYFPLRSHLQQIIQLPVRRLCTVTFVSFADVSSRLTKFALVYQLFLPSDLYFSACFCWIYRTL